MLRALARASARAGRKRWRRAVPPPPHLVQLNHIVDQ
jgi:hypothetical protein